MVEALPSRLSGQFTSVGVDLLPVHLTTTGVDIHLAGLEPTFTLPDVADDPEEEDDGSSKVRLKEGLGVEGLDGNIELGNEHKNDEDETEPRTVDASNGLEGDLVQSVAVVLPGGTEANVGHADGAPGEQSGQTRQRLEPGEDDGTARAQVDVGQATKDQDSADGEQRSSGLVNVCEDLGGVSLLGQGRQGTAATIDGRDTDGQDGNQNDDVHEAVKANQTGIFTDQDERRSSDVDVIAGAEQVGVVVGNQQADE